MEANSSEWPAFVGIDWGGSHHQVCVVDRSGRRQTNLRVTHDVAGLADLDDELGRHGERTVWRSPSASTTNSALSRSTSSRERPSGRVDGEDGYGQLVEQDAKDLLAGMEALRVMRRFFPGHQLSTSATFIPPPLPARRPGAALPPDSDSLSPT